MIIPFNQDMYFSDADHELARHNKISIPEVRAMFRHGLNTNINAHILAAYETRSLLNDTIEGALEDLNAVYRSLRYRMEAPVGKFTIGKTEDSNESAELEQKEKPGRGLRNLLSSNRDEEKGQQTDKYDVPDPDRRFMNVVIPNPEMFSYLSDKYQTNYFLFINQFELATNYDRCLDRATNNFERTVKVHFSLFDKRGDQIAGDFVEVKFGSNSNDIMEIMKNKFPHISQHLTAQLPVNERRLLPTGNHGEVKYQETNKDFE